MKASARSQKICVVTESDYMKFMKCPMKAHDSLIAERLFHDIPSCSPPTGGGITKASAHPPPGPPPGPLAPSITSWSSPVKICKPDHIQASETIFHEICSPPTKISKPDHTQTPKTIFHEICSPPTKICKAEKDSGPGNGTANVVTGFNIEQSFRRLSCEENKDSNDNKIKENNQCLDSVKLTQKENFVTKNINHNGNISTKKKINDSSSIKLVISNKSENLKNNKNENPWITVKGKTGPISQPRAKTNKENKSINHNNPQSKLAKQLSEGTKGKSEGKMPSQDFTTKFALRLLQNQPQTQQQQQQQQQQQKERNPRQKQQIDKKENSDKQRGNLKYQCRLGGQRDPRFQPEWRAACEQDNAYSSKAQQLLRKRRRSEGKGTRIIYERKFLMQCRQSPLAKTPPANLPHIPGVTAKDADAAPPRENGTIPEEPEKTEVEDEQFEMDL